MTTTTTHGGWIECEHCGDDPHTGPCVTRTCTECGVETLASGCSIHGQTLSETRCEHSAHRMVIYASNRTPRLTADVGEVLLKIGASLDAAGYACHPVAEQGGVLRHAGTVVRCVDPLKFRVPDGVDPATFEWRGKVRRWSRPGG